MKTYLFRNENVFEIKTTFIGIIITVIFLLRLKHNLQNASSKSSLTICILVTELSLL